MLIQTKRVYEAAAAGDGLRCLVDAMWPRGVKKADLACDLWVRTLSPSPPLRRLLHADPAANFAEFRTRYLAELARNPALPQFASAVQDAAPPALTLLYAFHDADHNHARVLAEALAPLLA